MPVEPMFTESSDHQNSVDSLLRSRRENPEEILLALGFGGSQNENVNPLNRIPVRFFKQQSLARGVSVTDLMRRRNQNFNIQETIGDSLASLSRRPSMRVSSSQEKAETGKTVRKTLVMGTKRYLFDDEQEVIHSPKTLEESSVVTTDDDHQGILFSKTPKSEPPVIQPVYRKLSCPVECPEWPPSKSTGGCDGKQHSKPENDFGLISGLLDIDVNSFFMMSSFIETSLLTSIQSLKMSLDFYRCFMFVSETGGETNNSEQRLTFQNLYLDVLEIETLLYDCLFKFKHSNNWYVFITKYVHQLRKAMDKIFQIQLDLQKLSKCADF